MCGRFLLESDIEQLIMRFDAKNNYLGNGTNNEIFPTNTVATIIRKENQNFIEVAKWGLESFYDKKPLINARGETVDEKTTFKKLFLNSRCIIPATSFFEWKTENNKKTKYQIASKDIEIFGMAGLYQADLDENGNSIMRCIIITSAASEEMSKIHERMPVILTKDNENLWLDSSFKDPVLLKKILKSYSGSLAFKIAENFQQLNFI